MEIRNCKRHGKSQLVKMEKLPIFKNPVFVWAPLVQQTLEVWTEEKIENWTNSWKRVKNSMLKKKYKWQSEFALKMHVFCHELLY